MGVRCAVLVVVMLSMRVPAAGAQTPDAVDRFVGKTVASVRLEGEQGRPETSPLLVSLVEIKAGEPLRVESLRSSVGHLYTVGRLEDASVELSETPDGGVNVLFKIVPVHPIDKVEFTGETGLSPGQLAQLVKERFGGRVPVNVPRARLQAVVKGLLADEGYPAADITPTTVPTHNPDRATLVIHVQAGSRTYVANLDVVGTSPLTRQKILETVGISQGQPYRRRAIDAGLATLRDDLRSQGYYEATATSRAVPTADRQAVDLTLTVNAGAKVRLVWAGDPKPAGNEEDYVPIRREGSADNDLLDDSDRRVELALKRDGYRDAHAEHTKAESAGELVVTFTVTRGRRFRIDHVEVTGNTALTKPVIHQELALSPGDVFYDARVNQGASRLLLEYQRRGFYTASVASTFEDLPADASPEGRLIVHLAVTEGPAGTIAEVQINGAKVLPAADVRAQMRSTVGSPYMLSQVAADRDHLEVFYRNLGFQAVNVTIKPELSADGRAVTLAVNLTEGPQIFVEDIRIIGNNRVSDKTIMESIKLHPGGPLGEADALESARALQSTGSFRSATVTAEPLLPGETRARVLVTVDEAPATTIGYGGGVEAGRRTRSAVGGGVEDFFELAPRGFFEIGRRNLWGKNRSVDFFSRLTLRPRSAPEDPLRDGRGLSFSEYRSTLTYRSLRVFHSDADFQAGASTERGIRTTFNFIRNSLTADLLKRLTPRSSVSGRYSLDFTHLLDTRFSPDEAADKLLIDRAFPNVRLSTLSTGVVWDRRDSPASPAHGTFLTADAELALRAIGSEVGYTKSFFQVSGFQPLSDNHRFVLAGRVQLGVARGFARSVTVTENGVPVTQIVEELPISQRFFGGGGSTVRGFQQDRLGVPAIINPDGLSIGGNGLIVLNAEVRSVVGKLLGHSLGVAGFVDSGNVFAKAADLDLGNLRTTLGFGVRYDSPLGPLRLDFGFKTERRLIGGSREHGWEYHLSLGEAF